MGWVRTLGRDALQEGVPRMVLADRTPVLLVLQDGKVHATSALCPHKFTDLSSGTLGTGCITCPQHDATFDLQTGMPGTDEGWAGRLEVYQVRIKDDRIEVDLPA